MHEHKAWKSQNSVFTLRAKTHVNCNYRRCGRSPPMVRAGDDLGPAKASVLLFTQDRPTGRSYVEALEKATIPVEWVRTHSELQSRLDRADLPRPALLMVLPSRHTPLQPSELANMASWLAADAVPIPGTPVTRSALEDALDIYCSMRALSRRQRQ